MTDPILTVNIDLDDLRFYRGIHALPPVPETPVVFDAVTDNVYELAVELAGGSAKDFGVKVCCSPDGRFETLIGYNAAEGKLRIDTTRTSLNQKPAKSIIGTARGTVESAPMKLGKGEALKLRVFVDRSMIEVFANDGRQALSRVVYPAKGHTGIKLYAAGGSAKASAVTVWDMMPTNPY